LQFLTKGGLRPRTRFPLGFFAPTEFQAIAISGAWVTLATALALPEAPVGVFPFRDLILFAAFAVVLGTLVLQGLTLRPLMSILHLLGDDVIAHEAAHARTRRRRGSALPSSLPC
jgi:NhaP-type Na+/H+ or K+/H+ antiporter